MIPIATDLERKKFPAATLAVIGVNAVIFIFELLTPEQALVRTFKHLSFGPDHPFYHDAEISLQELSKS